MNRKFILLLALSVVSHVPTFLLYPQKYEHASWLKELACNKIGWIGLNFRTATITKRIKKIFITDTKKWKKNNDFIPPHSFKENPTTVRLMTYNIRSWTNVLDTFQPHKILKVIKNSNPDIIMLQECAWGNPFNHLTLEEIVHWFRELGYAYGGEETFCTIDNAALNFGTLIFSRYPIVSANTARFAPTLPLVDREGYAHAYININNCLISCYTTHLSVESMSKNPKNSEKIRVEQLKQLTTLVDNEPPEVVISCIGGDFNSVHKKEYATCSLDKKIWNRNNLLFAIKFWCSRSSRALTVLQEKDFKDSFALVGTDYPKTTSWSGFWSDRLFFKGSPHPVVHGSYVFFNSASDHFGVLCDVQLPK